MRTAAPAYLGTLQNNSGITRGSNWVVLQLQDIQNLSFCLNLDWLRWLKLSSKVAAASFTWGQEASWGPRRRAGALAFGEWDRRNQQSSDQTQFSVVCLLCGRLGSMQGHAQAAAVTAGKKGSSYIFDTSRNKMIFWSPCTPELLQNSSISWSWQSFISNICPGQSCSQCVSMDLRDQGKNVRHKGSFLFSMKQLSK